MTVSSEENEQSISKKLDNTEVKYSDLYPERRNTSNNHNWFDTIFMRKYREKIDKNTCEINVARCVENSPLVKLLLGALKNSGCEVDFGRHISCEVCSDEVTGGYDPQFNQIIICQNNCRNMNRVQSTLSHELIHMFDYCRNKLDLNSLDHLACTEIRAANQCHCSFLGAMTRGLASPYHIKKAHQDCVIDKAVRSVVAVQNVSHEVAAEAVIRVFNKCYNDLEPVGRRLRRNSNDMAKAYYEGSFYGYVD